MKKIDITNKLNFEQKPIIVVKDEEIEVNNTAVVLMQVIPLFDDFKSENIQKAYELIFDESQRVKIEKLNLNFTDFTTLIVSAITLVAGDEMGEALTPAMT